MKKVLLIISIFLNIVLSTLYYFKTRSIKERVSSVNTDAVDYEITSMKNFEDVYFNRNDSLYKDLWNEAFENQPQSAFLISCSYLYVTKDKSILKDIELSIQQMEDVYQRKFRINEESK